MVAMPYKQNMIVNDQVVTGPFLSGNPTLRSQIAQISGTASIANQKYNSLQATLHKRFSSGIEYQVAYTWAHGMSDSIGYYGDGGQSGGQSPYWQNLFCQKCEWAPTYFDLRHSVVASFVYEMPWGRGKAMGASWNKFVDGVLGGWQLGGIFTAHTGFPLTIKYPVDPSGTGARSFRANVLGTPNDPHQIGPVALWLDACVQGSNLPFPEGESPVYGPPSTRTFGTAGSGIVNGPGMKRLDLSLGKKFNIMERRYIEIRGEAFNLTNTPIFSSPASQTITSSFFGQIRSSQGERSVQLVGKFYF